LHPVCADCVLLCAYSGSRCCVLVLGDFVLRFFVLGFCSRFSLGLEFLRWSSSWSSAESTGPFCRLRVGFSVPPVLLSSFSLAAREELLPSKARPASCSVLPFRPTASSLISLPASRSRRLVNLVDFPLASCVDSRSGSLLRLFYCFVYFSAEKVVPDRIPCCCQVGVAPVHP
jgi:hypothetical protein